MDPDVQAGRVVWQDFRDVGPGEIYLKDLEKNMVQRVTTNSFGQYHPVIYDNWIAWQDNRNGEVDIYGFDLLRNIEVQVTKTTENEARPYLDGAWCYCEEDSQGSGSSNLRLVHLPTLRAAPLTRSAEVKFRPSKAGNRLVWLESNDASTRIQYATLPVLQPVFQNFNAVLVTDALAKGQSNAFNLISFWNQQAPVEEIGHFTSLVPKCRLNLHDGQTARFQE